MKNSSRIVVNTGILYGKMFLNMGIALFSTRLILKALGTNDFGIFAIVGGVIGALSFLNKAMSTATQRFLSYNQGKGSAQIAKVFNTALLLHIFIGLAFVLILEIAGIFLFDGFLNIDENRIPVAKFVFHCTVVSTFFTVIAVPYDAIMNAKENMFVFALFSVLESIFKLGIAILLFYTPADRLATYGLCMALMMIFCRTIKRIYSRYKYKESKLNFHLIDWKMMKEMLSYSSWVTIEIISHIAKGDGIPVVLNLFFGTVVNASYGIATQVRHSISLFAEMLFKASNPQVMRNIGDGNIERSVRLSTTVCKFSFILMAILSLPLIVKCETVLQFWLGRVPEYSVIFCQLVLGTQLVIMTARGLNFLIDGVGKIRSYRLILSVLNVIVFPIAYGCLKLGMEPWAVFFGIILSDILVVVARLYYSHKYTGMNILHFCSSTLFRLLPLVLIAGLVTNAAKDVIQVNPILDLAICTLISTALLTGGFYLFVLDKDERGFAKDIFKKMKKKVS